MEDGKWKMEHETVSEVKEYRPFEEFDIWKRGFALAKAAYLLAGDKRIDRSIRDQMRRAALSIPSNIAEGYERRVSNEFRQYLAIAKGSAGELRTQIRYVEELNLADRVVCEQLIRECIGIGAMIGGFMKILKTAGK